MFLDRVQAGEAQAGGFFPALHDVHALDGCAGCALHQVVDGGVIADDSLLRRILIKRM